MNNRETEIKTFVEESREEITLLQSKAVKTIKKKEKEKFERYSSSCFEEKQTLFFGGARKYGGKKCRGSGAFTRRNGKFDPILRAYYQSREYVIPVSLPLAVLPSVFTVFPSPFAAPARISRPNAIKLLAARRANGEMSLTMVVIAGACRVSRFKSSFYLLHDRLNPIFVFIRTRFPGDRSIPSLPFLSLSLFLAEILRNSSIRKVECSRRSGRFLFCPLRFVSFFFSLSLALRFFDRRIFANISGRYRGAKKKARRIFRILFPSKEEIGVENEIFRNQRFDLRRGEANGTRLTRAT